MDRPSLEVVEKNSTKETPVLVVDSEGSIGEELAKKLKEYCFVVFAGKISISGENILSVPLKKTFPNLPNAPYSHLFVIYSKDGDIKNSLPQYVKESERGGSRLVVILRNETKLLPFVEKEINKLRGSGYILVLGDLFSGAENIPFFLDAVLEKAKSLQVTLPSVGLNSVHPMALNDSLDAILEIAFGTQEKKEVQLLFSKTPRTVLSLLHLLQKREPMLRIDFGRDETFEEANTQNGNYVFSPNYPIEEKFLQAYLDKTKGEGRSLVEFIKPKTNSAFGSFVHLVLSTAVFILILPFFLYTLCLVTGYFLLSSSKNHLEMGQLPSSSKRASQASSIFSLSLEFTKPIGKELSYFNSDTAFFEQYSNAGKDAASILDSISHSASLYKKVLTGNTNSPQDDILLATGDLKQAVSDYQKLKTSGLLPKNLEDPLISEISQTSSAILDIIPQVLQANKKQAFLILFQNNMELRPGGGFIGSYGILTLDKGKVSDFHIHDVYDADGQLKGHVEPPFPIRRYFPMVHWYLRDSNFDVDFGKDAQNAAFFLKEETGQVVDGVLALDVTMVKYVVQALGGVHVADYNENVTGDNFYLLTQKHAENNFFPGSTQKKDFLRSLFLAVEAKMSTGNVPYKKLLNNLKKGIDEKHVLLAFSNPQVQNVFSVSGLSSSLESQNNTMFASLSEANLGANKANYFLKRKVKEEVNLDNEGSISGKLSISYFNDSKQWPGGDYKLYLRTILPEDASVTNISIDGKDQAMVPAITDFATYEQKGFVPPAGLEVDNYQEDGKNIYGFITLVPSQKQENITLSFIKQIKVVENNVDFSSDYSIQPGTESYPFEFNFEADKDWRILSSSQNLKENKNVIFDTTKIAQDKSYLIKLSK